MPTKLTIEYLNHAALMIGSGAVTLLTDPWFSGPCFRGNWGLQYFNPTALDRAEAATHLWVSHAHSDHFHPPTLHALAQRNPKIRVLANHSFNFRMAEGFRNLGFTEVSDLPERQPVTLSESFQVERIPATGVDSMLVMRMGGMTWVNFNDCNLPASAVRMIVRRIGQIDGLLTNFNHAAKILEDLAPEQVIARQRAQFKKVVGLFNPRWTIPFASMHYYRSPYNQDQNQSLLQPADLADLHPSVRPLRVGDRAVISSDSGFEIVRCEPALPPAAREARSAGESVPLPQLQESIVRFCAAMRAGFFHVGAWIPPLTLRIEDLRVSLRIRSDGTSEEMPDRAPADIAAHSRSLYEWFGVEFGTDVFTVGGDFRLLNPNPRALRRWFLAGLLTENKLTPREGLRSLFRASGWGFLINRREEILSLLASGRFRGGEPRL